MNENIKKLPFKTKGIYARLIDESKENYYKETKIDKIFKIATGGKIEATYAIIFFTQNYKSIQNNEGIPPLGICNHEQNNIRICNPHLFRLLKQSLSFIIQWSWREPAARDLQF